MAMTMNKDAVFKIGAPSMLMLHHMMDLNIVPADSPLANGTIFAVAEINHFPLEAPE